jgi:outer membrane protein OmpA-like peptidoglycan-associated protein
MKRIVSIALSLALIAALSACSTSPTRKQKGTAAGVAIGAATGAVIGQAMGRDTEATLWGAAAGAVLGGLAGHQIASYMDRQEQDLQAVAAQSDALSIARSQNVLTATFKSDVLFDFNSANLKSGAYTEIDRVSRVLNQYPQTMIRVEGHTDSVGSETYNQQLSERRAESVKNALIQRNVDPRRIQTIGYGESMPISSVNAMNRRVNIVLVPIEAG